MSGRILLVDDMEVNRILIENLLSDLPFEVDCASGADEALSLLSEHTYDLCFFDHRMPGKDGITLLKELRSMEETPNQNCPCIAMTGDDFEDAENYYVSQGFDRFFLKPPDKARLLELVMEYLGQETSDQPTISVPAPEDELNSLPLGIRDNPFMDCLEGIKKCGDAEGYLSAISIFMDAIEKNSQELEESFSSQDINAYTIKVHGLKSTARMIGALSLAEQAAALEEAGNQNDFAVIQDKHADFLVSYKRFQKIHEIIKEEAARRARKKALLISVQESFSICGTESKLRDIGIECIYVPPNTVDLKSHSEEADLIIYYTDTDAFSRNAFHNYLQKLCTENDKKLILIGSKGEYSDILKIIPESCIVKWLERPIVMNDLLDTVTSYFERSQDDSPQSKQLLIVDDDVTYMKMIQEWMKGLYHVSMVESGMEAIKWLASNSVDLVLLDYEMPVMDGPQLLSILRQYTNTNEIPVMFLTGKQDRNSVMKAVGMRPAAYVLKTIDRASLIKKIDEYFESHAG